MLRSGLVNIAMENPETKKESLAAIEIMLDRMVHDNKVRKYETRMWRGEDALKSLEKPTGHLGYLGHLNLLLAYYHYLGGDKAEYTKLFKQVTDALKHKISATKINEAEGDGDSGPVLFDLSTSGTGFIVAGAKLYKDAKLLNALMLTAETAGFTFQWNGQRRYLLAPMVGDAIMLSMKTATTWNKQFVTYR